MSYESLSHSKWNCKYLPLGFCRSTVRRFRGLPFPDLATETQANHDFLIFVFVRHPVGNIGIQDLVEGRAKRLEGIRVPYYYPAISCFS
ncbi:MAG: hypothetical protein BECKG1743D_GA0114223_102281 [Candidatus Kentron sp. G]|nr:MAG: hypothetical protein BECKG1743E_GA0114224_102151 [Candidatus Kentron sp. G]VFN00839.1 MAG: hypothetical protein BECKG1743D_GA0114223_102281 [Candidatus Kentron sp. G]